MSLLFSWSKNIEDGGNTQTFNKLYSILSLMTGLSITTAVETSNPA
jgi:hypothetical protein